MTKERVVVYARVSSSEQQKGGNIKSQVTECLAYCERADLEVVEVYRDDGVSADVSALDERPAGEQLLSAAEEGKFSRVVIWDMDRLSRDTIQGSIALMHFEELGIDLDEMGHVVRADDDDDMARTMAKLRLVIGEADKNKRSRNAKRGWKDKVKAGNYYPGPVAPFGYQHALTEEGVRTVEPNPEHDDTVRQMFEWCVAGLGTTAIATRLNREGVPTATQGTKRQAKYGWSATSVGKVIRNTLYYGEVTHQQYKRKKVKGRKTKVRGKVLFKHTVKVPALVDRDLWDRANAAIKSRRFVIPEPKRTYMLSGLLRCRHCGGSYTARTRTGVNGDYHWYYCRERYIYGGAADHQDVIWKLNAEETEGYIQTLVRDFLSDPAKAQQRVDVVIERMRAEGDDVTDEMTALEKQIEDLQKQEERALDGWKQGIYRDKKQFDDDVGGVREKLLSAQARLEGLQAKGVHDEELRDEMQRAWLETLCLMGISATKSTKTKSGQTMELTLALDLAPEGWNEALRGLVETIWVEGDGSLTVEGGFIGTQESTTSRCTAVGGSRPTARPT